LFHVFGERQRLSFAHARAREDALSLVPGSACQRRRQRVRRVPGRAVHLKVAVVPEVTRGGVAVSLTPGRAAAAEESSSASPTVPTAARTRTCRRTGTRP